MTESLTGKSERTIQRLQARIDHLEENRRFIQNALEMVLSMADFNIDISAAGNGQLLSIAAERIKETIPLQGCMMYQVDDDSAEFLPAHCNPASLSALFESQVEFMIEEGFFALAIRERRGLYVASQDHRAHFLLHVIANNSRVKGMFVGLLEKGRSAIANTSLTLLSIALFNMATLMESMDLFRMVKNQNALLEQKVAERTRRLNASKSKLKEAMLRQERLAQAADQANRAKSLFLANMSHEIRTPLNGIIGCTEIALKSTDLNECHDLARISLNESEHLLNLINNVLDYSKIEAGKIELEQRPFDLDALVRSVADGMACQAGAKGLTLKTEYVGDLQPRVVGDALRLRQVLINLVNNAIKFTERGSVTIRVERRPSPESAGGQTLRFSVIDTGIGIARKRQKAIFQRFVQADESTTRRFGGTGLGTTIAYQLVQLMGGRLEVRSQPGKGAVFLFAIELAPAVDTGRTAGVDPAQVAGSEEPWGAPPVPGRILVAEDTPVNQMVLRKHLEEQGHSVRIAGNGREAVAACREERFDLILMDVQMPEMDGLEATRQIRSMFADHAPTPVVALTANADVKTWRECEAAGMDMVLTKPIRRAALLAEVHRWLAASAKSQDASQSTPERNEAAPGVPADPAARSYDQPVQLPVQAPPEAPIDLDTAAYEFGDRHLVRDVVEEWIGNVSEQIAHIRQAEADGDLPSIQAKSHAIKGGALTVEARPLADTAADLESLCQRAAQEELAPAIGRLVRAFEQLKGFVDTVAW